MCNWFQYKSPTRICGEDSRGTAAPLVRWGDGAGLGGAFDENGQGVGSDGWGGREISEFWAGCTRKKVGVKGGEGKMVRGKGAEPRGKPLSSPCISAVDWDICHVNWAAPCYFIGPHHPNGGPRWGHRLQHQLACEGLNWKLILNWWYQIIEW